MDKLKDARNSTAVGHTATLNNPAARALSEKFSRSMETSGIKREGEKRAYGRLQPDFIGEQKEKENWVIKTETAPFCVS
jgi:hypothetical protein